MGDAVRVGMLGLGVVGCGVARALDEKADAIARRAGRPVHLARVLVRDPQRPREYTPRAPLTADPAEILEDAGIDVVVEVLGGEQPACEYILAAIRRGKHVVTANKEVMAKHGPAILAAAAEQGVDVGFEASVGGGIPLIGPFRLDLLANELTSVAGILNGTTNYMLTAMATGTQTYAEALAEAQRLGYAEPDPGNDVEGIDAAYKLTILGSLAFHTRVSPSDVYYEGITRLAPSDFRYARELGYAIKLLALGRLVDGAVELRVHPAFVPRSSMLAAVDGVYNAVQVEGDLVGRVLFYGRGAGPGPTSSAVVADIMDLAQRVGISGPARLVPLAPTEHRPIRPMRDVRTRYYVRIVAVDRPGVIAAIAGIFGELDVSLASVLQKEDVVLEEGSRYAEIVFLTHEAREAAVQDAIGRIAALPVVHHIGSLIRVEG